MSESTNEGRWVTGADRCEWSDLPADQCDHCGAAPGSEIRMSAPGPGPRPVVREPAARTLERPTLPTTWAAADTEGECRCGRPTRDHAWLCDDCQTRFRNVLGDLPDLDSEIAVTITKQRAAGTSGSPRSTETALPWHERAADARRVLHGLLVQWVRFCLEENVRGPLAVDPTDGLNSLAGWLTGRVAGLSLLDIAPEAMDEITDAAAQCHSIVFWKRKNRIYLGPCRSTDDTDEDGNPIEVAPCPGELYADEGEPVGYCDLCGQPATVAVRRSQLEDDLDRHLATAAEIARLATYLGLDVPRDQVRRRVLYWHRHKRIEQRGTDTIGAPMFRYGEVRGLLYADFKRRAS